MTAPDKALSGLRVLVPRGGSWGEIVAQALRSAGATPVMGPLVDFAQTSEEDLLVEALRRLKAGEYDWMTATTATVVDVLAHHQAVIPPSTHVATVGEATAAAFRAAGYQVSRAAAYSNYTPAGLLDVWPEIDEGRHLKVLTLRSDQAKPVLTEALIKRGHDVTQVVSFRTVGVQASIPVREDVESGRINALLISSPRVAREVAKQFPNLPKTTIIACIGPHTHEEAVAAGLPHSVDHETDSEQKRALIELIESTVDYGEMQD